MLRTTEPLTDMVVRNAKPKSSPYKLFDGGGLFLLVSPAGGKLAMSLLFAIIILNFIY